VDFSAVTFFKTILSSERKWSENVMFSLHLHFDFCRPRHAGSTPGVARVFMANLRA
jgi:hypothetical protein